MDQAARMETRKGTAMSTPQEGSGAAKFLKGFAVINGVLAAIGAIAVWTTATQPRLEVSGGVHLVQGVNPQTVVTGVLILGEGILVSVVTFAIGAIVEHVIALRVQLDAFSPSTTTGIKENHPREEAGVPSPTRTSVPPGYRVTITSFGETSPAKIARILNDFLPGQYGRDAQLGEAPLVIDAGPSFATAEGMRAAFARSKVPAKIDEVQG